MRLHIRHSTQYRYSAPVRYSIQYLRLTPRLEAGQRIMEWRIDLPGRRWRQIDAFGNVTHAMAVTSLHDSVDINVEGTVETAALDAGVVDGPGAGPAILSQLPLEAFLVPTTLTEPDDAIRALAASAFADGRSPRGAIERLMESINGAVQYETGSTDVDHTASQALALGRGVCQDHAHLFVAAARHMGLPTRYVSGYLDTNSDGHLASHAWADVWLADVGWVSCDITHARYAGESYCRLAVGRDYRDASPVRGRREGGGEESLEVSVHVARLGGGEPVNIAQ
jgi:transglutaminase-like putative cysteine protease